MNLPGRMACWWSLCLNCARSRVRSRALPTKEGTKYEGERERNHLSSSNDNTKRKTGPGAKLAIFLMTPHAQVTGTVLSWGRYSHPWEGRLKNRSSRIPEGLAFAKAWCLWAYAHSLGLPRVHLMLINDKTKTKTPHCSNP